MPKYFKIPPSPHISTSLPRYFSTSLLLYFSTSLPRYFSTSLLLYFSTSLPRYLYTSLPLYFSTSLLLYLFASLLFLAPNVRADTLTSPNYTINMGNFNMTSGSKSSSGYNLTDTVGQTFQGQFDSAGYTVKAGFQYIYSEIPFTFVISDLNIDFGSLVAGTPSTATNTLTITSGSADGYAVTAIENHPLRIPATSTDISDTACDSGTPCTITDANIWSSNSRYGFGYNMSGTDTDSADFVDSTYFRPFANAQNLDTPAIVMSNSGVTASSISTVTYKVNISGTQAAGDYENTIQFIATPTY